MAVTSDYTQIAKEIMVIDSAIKIIDITCDRPAERPKVIDAINGNPNEKYAAITKLINAAIKRTSFIIEKHAENTNEEKSKFYKSIIEALLENETYTYWLRQINKPINIDAVVSGTIIKVNLKAENQQPFIILDRYLESIGNRPAANASDMVIAHYLSTNNYEYYFSDEGQITMGLEIHYLAEDFNYETKPNHEKYIPDYIKIEGESVKKGDIIVIVDDFNPTWQAQYLKRIGDAAVKYCETKIKELVLSQKWEKENTENKPPQLLQNIFVSKFKYKYPDIIKELAENQYGDDYPSPFIKIEGDKTIWETGITHSFSYLAGLFGALKKLNWIYNKKEKELIQIAKDTFHIEELGRTAFQKMKSGDLDDAFINPFEDIFKRIK